MEDQKAVVLPAGRPVTKEELKRVSKIYHSHIGDIIFSEQQIKERMSELGEDISTHFKDILKDDELLMCVPILKGGSMFSMDLIRANFTAPVEIDFLNVSSYGDSTESSGTVKLLTDLRKSVKGRHVLVVEDLLDTGHTLDWVQKHILAQEPASLTTVILLRKHGRVEVDVKLDFVGFECPNKFIVGYGMDFAEKYRELPFVCVLNPVAYA